MKSSGATGGSETHNHKWYDYYQNGSAIGIYVTGSDDWLEKDKHFLVLAQLSMLHLT